MLYLVANRAAMAFLAGLVVDFLVCTDPEALAYSIDHSVGLRSDSPTLVIEFDRELKG